MDTAKILSLVNDALDMANTDRNCAEILRVIRDDLEDKLRMDAAKSRGSVNAVTLLKRVCKACKDSGREALAYAWIDSDGRQCVCDGYRAYRLKEPVPMEPRPNDIGTPIDLGKIFPPDVCGWQEVELPALADLKAHVAIERAKRGKTDPLWDLGPSAPTVNAQYLLEAMQLFPGAVKGYHMGVLRPVYLCDEHGEALVLPVRAQEPKQTKPAVTDAERAAAEADEKREQERNAELRADWERRNKLQEQQDEAFRTYTTHRDKAAKISEAMKKADNDAEREKLRKHGKREARNAAMAKLQWYSARYQCNEREYIPLGEFEAAIKILTTA